jgi:hypothetical protein
MTDIENFSSFSNKTYYTLTIYKIIVFSVTCYPFNMILDVFES